MVPTKSTHVDVIDARLTQHEQWCIERYSELKERLGKGNERMFMIEQEARSLKRFVTATLITVLSQLVLLLSGTTMWLLANFVFK